MFRKLLLAAALSLISGSAFAVCGAIPLTIKDAAAATQNISSATAADGNCKTYIDADTSSQMHTDLTAPIPAGTNAIGVVSISPTAASGGWTHFSSPHDNSNTAITTTVVAVKSSAAGKFGGYYISNTNATVACLQVFDIATAGGVTLGTTRPDMVYCVPATSGANLELGNGVAMTNGIQIAATTTASGSSALGAGLDVTIYFK